MTILAEFSSEHDAMLFAGLKREIGEPCHITAGIYHRFAVRTGLGAAPEDNNHPHECEPSRRGAVSLPDDDHVSRLVRIIEAKQEGQR